MDIEDVVAAAAAIGDAIVSTPVLPAPALSAICGGEVFVKYENMQATGSFKERGALYKLLRLAPEQRARGVIAMSAGNHAQAMAYHAAKLGIPATVVMPKGTPLVKIESAKGYGARVILEGWTLEEAEASCRTMAAREGLTLVHPYDDADVIAGQGTVALEIFSQVSDIDAIVAPVGGGGLLAGVAIVAQAVSPNTRVVGVEADRCASFLAALRGEAASFTGGTLAEGIAVQKPGALNLEIARRFSPQMILVSETDLEQAVSLFAVKLHTMSEGAGAAGLAALLAQPDFFRNRRTVLILSGGNIDPRILSEVMMRDLERRDRIVTFRVTLGDRPGLLGAIATRLGESGANILEVSHRRLMLDVPAKGVSLRITMETRDRSHAESVLAALARDGLSPRRVSAGDEGDLLD